MQFQSKLPIVHALVQLMTMLLVVLTILATGTIVANYLPGTCSAEIRSIAYSLGASVEYVFDLSFLLSAIYLVIGVVRFIRVVASAPRGVDPGARSAIVRGAIAMIFSYLVYFTSSLAFSMVSCH